jgi:orotidine-5'-phosphate decarboxylase
MNDKRNFIQMTKDQWDRGKFVCVGLDSDLEKIPESAKKTRGRNNRINVKETIFSFNKSIISPAKDLVHSYKLNFSFYIRHGSPGLEALEETIDYIKWSAPNVPVILDVKCGDIDNSNDGYVYMGFDLLQADALTVNPYLGGEALQPFLSLKDKGIIVLCRTSNSGAGEFQDLISKGKPFYQHVAYNFSHKWNKNNNCLLVVGATYPDELREVRKIVRDMPILIPGLGAQGGDIEETIAAGKDSRGKGMIINSSRGIIFASSGEDFAEAAYQETVKLHNSILACI